MQIIFLVQNLKKWSYVFFFHLIKKSFSIQQNVEKQACNKFLRGVEHGTKTVISTKIPESRKFSKRWSIMILKLLHPVHELLIVSTIKHNRILSRLKRKKMKMKIKSTFVFFSVLARVDGKIKKNKAYFTFLY